MQSGHPQYIICSTAYITQAWESSNYRRKSGKTTTPISVTARASFWDLLMGFAHAWLQ